MTTPAKMDASAQFILEAYEGDECSWYDLPCVATSVMDWWFEFSVWLTFKIYEKATDGVVQLLNNLPVPSFVLDAVNAMGGIPPAVVFFASALQIKEGIAMILGAYLTRWALKFVPFVG